MAKQPRVGDEVRQLKGLLAGLSLDTKLLRLEQALRRKDWSDQPRAPAGQSNGGRWAAGGGGDGEAVDPDVLRLIRPQWAQMPAAEPAQTREETRLDDGTRVLSIRIRAGRRDFDEQHAVTAPDGESRLDQYHSPQPTAACVYEYKTGLRGLSWSDAVRYATVSKMMFPKTQRILVIQMRESP